MVDTQVYPRENKGFKSQRIESTLKLARKTYWLYPKPGTPHYGKNIWLIRQGGHYYWCDSIGRQTKIPALPDSVKLNDFYVNS